MKAQELIKRMEENLIGALDCIRENRKSLEALQSVYHADLLQQAITCLKAREARLQALIYDLA